MTWRDDAACREIGTELFFVEGDGPGSLLLRRQAKAFCGSCPVILECREWALSQDLTTIREGGILGGMSPRELVREKTRREGTPARPRPGATRVCVSCGEPMAAQRTPTHVRYAASGLCSVCYQRQRRDSATPGGPPLRCTRCASPMRTQTQPIPGTRTVRHAHDGWCVRCAATGDLRDRRPA